MRLSISAKVLLGYAAVLATFALVTVFGVVQLRTIGAGLALVSQAYHPLTRLGAQLDSSWRNSEQATARLLDDQDPRTRRALLQLALDYHPKAAREKLRTGLVLLERARETPAGREELAFLERLDGLLARVGALYEEYARAGERVRVVVEAIEKADPEQRESLGVQLDTTARGLKRMEKAIGAAIGDFTTEVEGRIDLRVREAAAAERRSTRLILVMALLAVAVGIFVTFVSLRVLAPIRGLTQAAKEVGAGRFEKEIVAASDDELGVLAREFNTMARNLSERDRLLAEKGAEVVRAERLAAVGRLAAQITHEIRNPLSSLSLNAELLQEALASEQDLPAAREELRSIVRAMGREVDRLAEVTEQYLSFARLPKPAVADVDLNEAVDDLLDFVAPELTRARVVAERHLAPEGPLVHADPAQLRQVLLNLVRNAREAMASGGKLVVSTGVEAGRGVVTVADDGPGMPESLRARIFEPFFSTKEGGTGLGLALVQQIVHEHGGEIRCDSAPGSGTRMVVTLPLAVKRGMQDLPVAPALHPDEQTPA